ncbi:proline-rich receptor-like protein kinase PERK10 [Homalodisca vitripennis]|uniref:proline-rich receptor-like protein kinase PERK10 n=1 Tax=Homalodisca vitripennis TaxID=197043 RepID=UPI001EEA0368|nr:proline-rich receptor-like protein kinase PERK10 [Homalodisca vitripennis]
MSSLDSISKKCCSTAPAECWPTFVGYPISSAGHDPCPTFMVLCCLLGYQEIHYDVVQPKQPPPADRFITYKQPPPDRLTRPKQTPTDRLTRPKQPPPDLLTRPKQPPPDRLTWPKQSPPDRFITSKQPPPDRLTRPKQTPIDRLTRPKQSPPYHFITSKQPPPDRLTRPKQPPPDQDKASRPRVRGGESTTYPLTLALFQHVVGESELC